MVLARTAKGKGVDFLEDHEGFHGKALSNDQLRKAVAQIRRKIDEPEAEGGKMGSASPIGASPTGKPGGENRPPRSISTDYSLGDMVATRDAYGSALVKLGEQDPFMMVLDGDVKNSTRTESFFERFPDRSIECYIAEQNMVGIATGLQARGCRVFAATFAAFLTRAHDQIRMAAYSLADLKLAGSHTGVAIGQDGPSQMGLEDIAMMRSVFGSVVLCPCDAVSAEKLTCCQAGHKGISYLRAARQDTPVIYDNEEEFLIGGSKTLRRSDDDAVTFAATGRRCTRPWGQSTYCRKKASPPGSSTAIPSSPLTGRPFERRPRIRRP
jgi:transketolase